MSTNTSPDIFYMDVLINNIASDTPINPAVQYNTARSIPYLYNPDAYYASVVQFTLDAPTLGVMTFEIVPSAPNAPPPDQQTNVNLGIYEVGLEYNGSVVFQNLIWEPQNQTVPVPPPPSDFQDGFQDTSTSYYTVYAYSYFNIILNKALQACYNKLLLQQPTLPAVMQMNMDYISDTTLFSLYVNEEYFNQSTNDNPITLYFNGALNNLYSYMVTNKQIINGNTYYKYLFNNTTTFPDTTLNPVEIYMKQEGPSIVLWTQIVSIVIASQSLPIYQTTVFDPLVYYNGDALLNGNNALSENIILEYMIKPSFYNEKIVYEPLAQYQLVELNSTSPLYNFDLRYYARTNLGKLKPIFLSSGSSCFTKIGFFKKTIKMIK